MEVLRTHDTGHADSHLNWVICGASGYGLRDQRREGHKIVENNADGTIKVVAESKLFIGRKWHAAADNPAYSGLRIDIASGSPLSIRLTPLVSVRDGSTWNDVDPDPITLNT
jgi:hypothetical protein